MVDQSFVTLPKNIIQHIHTDSYISTGFSKAFINKPNHQMGFSVTHQDSRKIKKMDSSRVLGDHKRRCFEKLVVCKEQVKEQVVGQENDTLEVEVIDDTALIEMAGAGGFKNSRGKKGSDVGFGHGKKKKRDNGFKKPSVECSMKCVNEKKGGDGRVVEEQKWVTEKKVEKGKGWKEVKKMSGKVKAVYRRKDDKNVKKERNGVEEHRKVDNLSVPGKIGGGLLKESKVDLNLPEKIVGKAFFQKNAMNLKVSNGKENDLNVKKMSGKVKAVYRRKDTKNPEIVGNGVEEHQKVDNLSVSEKSGGGLLKESEVDLNEKIVGEAFVQESEVNVKVSNRNEKELVEIETVDEKDDGLKLNPKIDVCIVKNCENETVGSKKVDLHTKKNKAVDENVSGNTTVGLKKIAYSREELKALRFVDGEGQKKKWNEVFFGFAPTVARDYARLVVDVINRQPQRYNHVVNYGSTCQTNAILGMPPVLPLCSSSNDRRFPPYDRVGFRANFY